MKTKVWFGVAVLVVYGLTGEVAKATGPPKVLIINGGGPDETGVMNDTLAVVQAHYLNACWEVVTLNNPTWNNVKDALTRPDRNLKAIVVLAHGKRVENDTFFFVYGPGGVIAQVWYYSNIRGWLDWMPYGQLDEVILHFCYSGSITHFVGPDLVVNQVFQGPKFVHSHWSWELSFAAFWWETVSHWPRRVCGSATAVQVEEVNPVFGSCDYKDACREAECADGTCSSTEDQNVVCGLEHLKVSASLLCQGDEVAARVELREALACLEQVQNPDIGTQELILDIKLMLGLIPAVSTWGLVVTGLLLITSGTVLLRHRRQSSTD